MEKNIELKIFQIISNSTSAKAEYSEAVKCARRNKFDEAWKHIKNGEDFYSNAHHYHAELVTMESNGEKFNFSLLLMHAEDQMSASEQLRFMSVEVIELYERLGKNE